MHWEFSDFTFTDIVLVFTIKKKPWTSVKPTNVPIVLFGTVPKRPVPHLHIQVLFSVLKKPQLIYHTWTVSISSKAAYVTYTGSTPSQILSSQSQRPNEISLDVFLQANSTHFLKPSPFCSHTPISCLPVYSVSYSRTMLVICSLKIKKQMLPLIPSLFLDQLLQTVHLQSHLAFNSRHKVAMNLGYFTKVCSIFF